MSLLNSNNHPFPYIDFNGRAHAMLSVSLNENGIDFQIKKPEMTAQSEWSVLMSSWRKSKVGGKPWMSMITPRVNKALDQTKFNYSWSDMGLGDLVEDVDLIEHLNFYQLNFDLKNQSDASVDGIKL